METKTINLYEFEELSKEVQEKVLNEFRERTEHYFLYDNLRKSLFQKLEDHKIKYFGDIELYYSLSYCQGDGLNFQGLFKYKDLTIIIKSGHLSNLYSHSKTVDIIFENENGEEVTEEEKKKNGFEDLYLNICDELEKEGYSEIEYNNSDESIKEDINANEYKFKSNGEIEN